MPTSTTLDIERLTMPLSNGSAAAASFSSLKAARQQAAIQERKMEDGGDGDEQADPAALAGQWRTVRELAEKVLVDEAKDLGAAAFLIESLLRSDGFAGLRDAFRLTRQLAEKYWDEFCPRPEDAQKWAEQVSDRLGLLASLNGRDRDGSLILPLRRQPLTEAREKGPFALWHYQDAERLAATANDAARDRGAALMAEIEHEVALSSAEFLITLRDDLQGCVDEFAALCTELQARSGLPTAPFSLAFPSSNVENVLQRCLAIAKRNAESRVPVDASQEGEESQDAASSESSTAGQPQASGGKQTREGALRTLDGLARFFEQTDPHSPLAPALRQIVRWARTPLGDLYAELIPDEDARKSLFKLIGVKLPEGND